MRFHKSLKNIFAFAFLYAMNCTAIAMPTQAKALTPTCQNAIDFLDLEGSSAPQKRGSEKRISDTDAFIVLNKGKKVFERYAPGFNSETPHRMWSSSKMIANLIVARAISEGRLTLEQRLDEFFPGSLYQTKPENLKAYRKITIRDLLMMRSGFQWEELESTDIKKLNVVQMIYGSDSKDVLNYILRQPLVSQSGVKIFNYSTGDYNILSGILRKVYGQDYEKLPWKLFFNPMEMKNVAVERDRAGTYLLGSNVYMSANDLLKVGKLLLAKGMWKGKRMLPAGWVEFMSSPNAGQMTDKFSLDRLKKVGILGAPLYLNSERRGLPRQWPDFPEDTIMSFGFMGQNLAIIPSKDLVFLRFGQDIVYGRKINSFGKKLFACLNEGGF